jgi:hypothetical protein
MGDLEVIECRSRSCARAIVYTTSKNAQFLQTKEEPEKLKIHTLTL